MRPSSSFCTFGRAKVLNKNSLRLSPLSAGFELYLLSRTNVLRFLISFRFQGSDRIGQSTAITSRPSPIRSVQFLGQEIGD